MIDWKIDLSIDGQEFCVLLIDDRNEASRRQGRSSGYCVFSNREVYGLNHAASGDPLDASMAKAICMVKKILGGTITDAYKQQRS